MMPRVVSNGSKCDSCQIGSRQEQTGKQGHHGLQHLMIAGIMIEKFMTDLSEARRAPHHLRCQCQPHHLPPAVSSRDAKLQRQTALHLHCSLCITHCYSVIWVPRGYKLIMCTSSSTIAAGASAAFLSVSSAFVLAAPFSLPDSATAFGNWEQFNIQAYLCQALLLLLHMCNSLHRANMGHWKLNGAPVPPGAIMYQFCLAVIKCCSKTLARPSFDVFAANL